MINFTRKFRPIVLKPMLFFQLLKFWLQICINKDRNSLLCVFMYEVEVELEKMGTREESLRNPQQQELGLPLELLPSLLHIQLFSRCKAVADIHILSAFTTVLPTQILKSVSNRQPLCAQQQQHKQEIAPGWHAHFWRRSSSSGTSFCICPLISLQPCSLSCISETICQDTKEETEDLICVKNKPPYR